MLQRLPPFLASALLLAACDATRIPAPADVGRIVLLAGYEVADTVFATPAEPLVFEVRDASGRPVPGSAVTVHPVAHPLAGRVIDLLQDGRVFTSIETVTDASGRGEVAYRFRGPHAVADAAIAIAVPALALADTAWYSILPGRAAGLQVTSPYSLMVGDTGRAFARMLDAWGNVRADTVHCAAADPRVRIGAACALTGTALANARVTASAAGFEQTGDVRVLPRGRIGYTTSLGSISALATTHMAVVRQIAGGMSAWLPGGDSLVTVRSGNLWVVDTLGTGRELIPALSGSPGEAWPQATVDGAWIYFSALTGTGGAEIWRARRDGSAAARAGPASASGRFDTRPAPIPGSNRVAYESCPSPAAATCEVRVVDVVSGDVAFLATGRWPAAAPDGARIAFTQGDLLRIVTPDGLPLAAWATPGSPAEPAWSPDGRYIIAATRYVGPTAATASDLFILEVASGEFVRLPPAPRPGGSLTAPPWASAPSWRP